MFGSGLESDQHVSNTSTMHRESLEHVSAIASGIVHFSYNVTSDRLNRASAGRLACTVCFMSWFREI